MQKNPPGDASDFDHLTYDLVLHLVEEALGKRSTNLCRPLNSYINRVYEVHLEGGEQVIAKFYRPGRWSREALRDEQDFLTELAEEEIPVVAPLPGAGGEVLHEHHGMFFSVFPKRGGRIVDEPDRDQWRELGRLVSRVHQVGRRQTPRDRITMIPSESTERQLDEILDSNLVTDESRDAYEDVALETIDMISPLFEDEDLIRIHGDLHHQNLIYRPGESFYVIDFDDMALGVPVQDIWMLLPGRVADAKAELNTFLEGYETFQAFEDASLRLVEPLRAMRYIHYTAWCVRQAEDGGFTRLTPDWGSNTYWQQEVHELRKQQQEIRDALEGNVHP